MMRLQFPVAQYASIVKWLVVGEYRQFGVRGLWSLAHYVWFVTAAPALLLCLGLVSPYSTHEIPLQSGAGTVRILVHAAEGPASFPPSLTSEPGLQHLRQSAAVHHSGTAGLPFKPGVLMVSGAGGGVTGPGGIYLSLATSLSLDAARGARVHAGRPHDSQASGEVSGANAVSGDETSSEGRSTSVLHALLFTLRRWWSSLGAVRGRQAGHGVTAVRLDYSAAARMPECEADVRAALQYMHRSLGMTHVVLVGWSFGGSVVIRQALEVKTQARRPPPPTAVPVPVPVVVAGVVGLAPMAQGAGGVAGLSRSAPGSHPPVPLFLVHGDRDTVLPVEGTDGLYAAAGQPKELLVSSGDNHGLSHSRERVAQAVLDFTLQALAAAASTVVSFEGTLCTLSQAGI